MSQRQRRDTPSAGPSVRAALGDRGGRLPRAGSDTGAPHGRLEPGRRGLESGAPLDPIWVRTPVNDAFLG